MKEKNMLNKVFDKVNGNVLGALLAISAAVAPINEALAKTHVTLNEYIELQRNGDPGTVHRDYSPYVAGDNTVDVQIYSSEHGSFLLNNFNCETLIPYSPRGAKQGAILATEGAIASVHAGLGARNLNDPDTIKKTMEALARGAIAVITPNDADTMAGIDHLNSYHGIDLYDVVRQDGRNHLIPQPEMQKIIGACVGQLNR